MIIEFTGLHYFVKDQHTFQTILNGSLHDGLYLLHLPLQQQHALQASQVSITLWHSRLVHCSPSIISSLTKHHKISASPSTSFCSTCIQAKAHKLSFLPSTTKVTSPLEIVHTDVWGPAPVTSSTGNKYYVHFVDQFSHFGWLFACACKADIPQIFVVFKARVKNLLSCKIKTIQCDGGSEFSPLRKQFPEITFHLSCPYTPQ
jgi:GAG-pre-integrase domain